MPSATSKGYDSSALEHSIETMLSGNVLCSIATVNPAGTAHINTCFYAFDKTYNLFVLTPPSAQHSKNILSNPEVAVGVFDSHQASGAQLRGMQLFGTCQEVTEKGALSLAFDTYANRFANIKEYADTADKMLEVFDSRIFKIAVKRIKLFDEPTFGKETWIDAMIS